MKKAKTLVLALALVCFSFSNAFAQENTTGFNPRFYFSLFTGLSYEKPSSDHNFHWSMIQVGVTLFETKKLLFAKMAYGALMGAEHDSNDCSEDINDTLEGVCGADAHSSLIFSPVLIKMLGGGESPVITFDIGIDHEKRLVAAFGLAF